MIALHTTTPSKYYKSALYRGEGKRRFKVKGKYYFRALLFFHDVA